MLVAFWWAVDLYEGKPQRAAWLVLEMWLIVGVADGLARFAIEKWRPNTMSAQRSRTGRFIRRTKFLMVPIVFLVIVADDLPSRFQHKVFNPMFEILVIVIVLLILADNLDNESELRRIRKQQWKDPERSGTVVAIHQAKPSIGDRCK